MGGNIVALKVAFSRSRYKWNELANSKELNTDNPALATNTIAISESSIEHNKFSTS